MKLIRNTLVAIFAWQHFGMMISFANEKSTSVLRDFVGNKYKADLIVGRGQNFSSCSTDHKIVVHYSLDDFNAEAYPIHFNMASGWSWHHGAREVLYPVTGEIYDKIDISNSGFKEFQFGSRIVEFEEKRFTVYVLENEADYSRRVKFKDCLAAVAKGRFIAKIEFDLFHHKIVFYQIDEGTSPPTIFRTGVFKGKSKRH